MKEKTNTLELIDKEGATHIKINGQEIFRVLKYELIRDGIDLEIDIRTSIDEKTSSINVVREYGTITKV